jgi:hypothetical protein
VKEIEGSPTLTVSQSRETSLQVRLRATFGPKSGIWGEVSSEFAWKHRQGTLDRVLLALIPQGEVGLSVWLIRPARATSNS